MEPLQVDLKKTVHLPQTGFSMKANLAQLDPKLVAHWDATHLYDRIRQTREGQPTYILHDGPHYANGNIQLLKDFIVNLRSMRGFDSPYVPGWDCHGLPIGMSVAQIRAACRKYAEKYVDLQRKDFIRLGVLGRWQAPRLNISAQYEGVIAQAFVEFLDRGYVT
jgi:isoleucyl-tRNA synthetase